MGPILSGDVIGKGTITVRGNTSCAMAKVQVFLESNTCRIGGCKWKPLDQSELTLLPESGELTFNLRGKARKGSHEYHIRINEVHTELGFSRGVNRAWFPFLETKNKSFEGRAIRIET
jgi:hypothetical protein